MSCSDTLLLAVSEYENLAAAYEAVYDCLIEQLDEPEEWLINLQNHLIWNSYQTCNDDDCDVVVLAAISSVMKRLGIRPQDLTGEIRRILDELTLV